jgi:eukaryotic-like serine/threonine-protein kinase
LDPLIEQLGGALSERYRIERELGTGGMATVYLAHDLRHDRKVALKVLRPDLAAVIGPERFLSEIRTTANLQHPHILPLHDSGSADGRVFYVMPFVEGESLRDRLDREKQLPVADAVRIATEVADALDYAHRHDVIHRDVKPENILLHDGRAVVADFGIALAASRTDGGTRLTETGLSLGTPAYMSPEQALGERDLDSRSDVYALGATLYEMLAGEPPFTGPTAQSILAKIMTAEPDSVTTYRKTVPPHVADAIHTALEKLPADRFGSAREFAAALTGTVGGTAARRPRPAAAARSWIPAAMGLALVVLAGTVGFFGGRMVGGEADRPGGPILTQIDPRPASGFGRATLHTFTFTPDGGALVFAAGDDGQRRLYRRPLDQSEATPLAGTEGAANPFVSPDGRWIGFLADGGLRRVPATGGAAQLLHDLRAVEAADRVAMGWGSEVGGVNEVVYGASWLPNDSIVYGRFSGGLRTIPAGGGPPRALTELDAGEFGHRLPYALPGGQAVVFTVVEDLTADFTHIEALILRTGERRRLVENAADARYDASGHLLFARTGSIFAVRFDPSTLQVRGEPFRLLPDVMHAVAGNTPGASSGAAQFDIAPDGTLAFLTGGAIPLRSGRLTWIERGGRTEIIDVEPMSYLAPRVSPDGRQLVVTARVASGPQTLRLIDLERGVSSLLARGLVFPLWTPDGTRLVAASPGAGGQNLYSLRLDGSGGPELLVESRHPLWPGSISADGRWLAFVESNPTTGNDIWILDLEAGGPARPLVRSEANLSHPGISPDGRWLVYGSDESGANEVYVRPFDGSGLPVQVSRGGGRAPTWAADGRAVYHAGPDRNVYVTAIDVTGGLRIGPTELFAAGEFWSTSPVGTMEVAPNGSRVLMTVPADPGQDPLELGAPIPLNVLVNARSLLVR